MNIYRALAAFVTATVVTTGCATSVANEDVPSGKGIGATTPRSQPRSVEHDESGRPIEITWSRPPARVHAHGAASSRPDFQVSKFGETRDEYVLYFDLIPVSSADPRIREVVAPEVILVLNNCPAESPKFDGNIVFGSTSKLWIPKHRLPKGELNIDIRAHHEETSIYLKHDDEGIRPMTPDEAKGYTVIPGAPAKGDPGAAGLRGVVCP